MFGVAGVLNIDSFTLYPAEMYFS